VFTWGCYRDSNGHIGFNGKSGPLPKGAQEKALQPELVVELQGVQITCIASGGNHTLAVRSGAHGVYAWGCAEQGQLGREEPDKLKALVPVVPGLRLGGSSGTSRRTRRVLNANFASHVAALLRDRPAGDWTAAMDEYEAHGKALGAAQPDAGPVSGAEDPPRAVFAGAYHSLVLTSSGAVWAFGLNNMGQLGVRGVGQTAKPVRVTGLDGKGVESMDGGEHHSVALCGNGDVYTFGRGDYGQLGTNDGAETAEEPVLVRALQGKAVRKVCCGSHQTAAVTADGRLYTWGFGEMYQLARGSKRDEAQPRQVDTEPLGSRFVLDASMGAQHTVVLATDIE